MELYKEGELLLTCLPSLGADYPASMRSQLGDRLPAFTKAEFALLREAELDFYGMNYYTSEFARHRKSSPPATDYKGNVDDLQEDSNGLSIGELSGVDWLRSAPEGFRKHLVRIYKKYGKPIYVTENGCPCPGEEAMSKEECIKDGYRQRYLSQHLDAILAARQDGADVAGYFAWSLMDNFGESLLPSSTFSALRLAGMFLLLPTNSDGFLEWAEGYSIRFGLTHIDYKTLERTPKESALKIRDIILERTE